MGEKNAGSVIVVLGAYMSHTGDLLLLLASDGALVLAFALTGGQVHVSQVIVHHPLGRRDLPAQACSVIIFAG